MRRTLGIVKSLAGKNLWDSARKAAQRGDYAPESPYMCPEDGALMPVVSGLS